MRGSPSIPGNIVCKDISPGLYDRQCKFIILRILPLVSIYKYQVIFLRDRRKDFQGISIGHLYQFRHSSPLEALLYDVVKLLVYLDGIHPAAKSFCPICQAGKRITGKSPYLKYPLTIVPHNKIAEIQTFLPPYQHLSVIGAGVSLPLDPVQCGQ